jgi:hypothetical protein
VYLLVVFRWIVGRLHNQKEKIWQHNESENILLFLVLVYISFFPKSMASMPYFWLELL